MTMKLHVNVSRTSHYVNDGKTTFVFEGTSEAVNAGRPYVLSVAMSTVPRPVDGAQLALTQPGDILDLEVHEFFEFPNYVHVSQVHQATRTKN